MALKIVGRGARRTGPRFFGGGFGLEGAAEGMLIATALGLLVNRTKFDTVVCIQTRAAEVFLHDSRETPDALRMRLSEVFPILRDHARNRRYEPHKAVADPVESLAKLGDMLDRGLVNRDEFDQLKRELLSG